MEKGIEEVELKNPEEQVEVKSQEEEEEMYY